MDSGAFFEEFWERDDVEVNFGMGGNNFLDFLVGARGNGAFDGDDGTGFEVRSK